GRQPPRTVTLRDGEDAGISVAIRKAGVSVEEVRSILSAVNDVIWGPFVLVPLLFVTGIFLTIRLGGLQFRLLGHALWLAFVRRKEQGGEGDISHYQALSTALAATVGVGNIAGARSEERRVGRECRAVRAAE